jgi:hypothetical protein
MLFRRTILLVDYEDANRALDKAKPAKRKAVSNGILCYSNQGDGVCLLHRCLGIRSPNVIHPCKHSIKDIYIFKHEFIPKKYLLPSSLNKVLFQIYKIV